MRYAIQAAVIATLTALVLGCSWLGHALMGIAI